MVGGGWVLGGGWVVDGDSPAPRDGGIVVLPCYYFVILVLNTEDTAPICFCPPYRPATGIFREYH